ncbi:MAG TPA: holo-[acyl-carrier-protein] synthase [Verrucomicrobiae bacterium]|nr:holo-[acyl-carrier-protein] synthase [Verrucomicrobiae bacterium]
MIVGTGVDIVEISRFERFVADGNRALLERVFSDGERAYCDARKRSAQHYALRFAAKEAFLKALGLGLRQGISWQDMEVVNDPLGKPELRLAGAAERIAREMGVSRAFLSMSHDGNFAVASVVLEGA